MNVDGSDVGAITIRGLTGDDTFNLTAVADIPVTVEGDASGNDVLTFNSTGATIVDLGNSTIDDAGANGTSDVTYSGIETIRVAGGTQATLIVSMPL